MLVAARQLQMVVVGLVEDRYLKAFGLPQVLGMEGAVAYACYCFLVEDSLVVRQYCTHDSTVACSLAFEA